MKYPFYSAYRSSGVGWLGDVPEHWRVDRLKWSASDLVNGIWGDEPDGENDLICVRVADFDRVGFRVVDAPPTVRAISTSDRKGRILQRGDLLIEKSGGGENQLVGCVVLFDSELRAVSSNFVARMPSAAGMDPRFWTYVHASLYSGRLNYPAVKQTTGIQNLDSQAYMNTLVCFPPPDEQRSIAAFLDAETLKLDTLIEKKRQLIGTLKEKRAALISRTVTRGLPPDAAIAVGLDPHPKLKPSGVEWLGDIPEHWDMGKFSREVRITEGQVDPETEPYASMLLVAPNHIEPSTGRLLAEETAEEQAAISGKYYCFKGDVIYSKIRPALAKATICSARLSLQRRYVSNQGLGTYQ